MTRFAGLAFVLVLLSGGQSLGQEKDLGMHLDGIIAVVGDEVVTRSELSDAMAYGAALLQARKEAGAASDEVEAEFRSLQEETRDNLVDNRLILLAARQEGMNVDEEVRRRIDKLKKGFAEQPEKLKRFLGAQGFGSVEEYERQMRDELLRQRVVFSFVRPKSEVTRKELEAAFDERHGGEVAKRAACAGALITYYALEQVMLSLPEDASYGDVMSAYTAAWKCRMSLISGTATTDSVPDACAWSGGRPVAGALGDVDETSSFDPAFQQAFDDLKTKPASTWSDPFIIKDGVRILLSTGSSTRCIEDSADIERLKDRLKARLEDEKFRRVLEWWLEELRGKYRVDIKKLL